jgi:phage tail tape-measure protein
MSDDSRSELEFKFYETKGALDLLFTLREEFAQWVEEAQDDSKLEALENVLGHIQAIENEYKQRFAALEKQLATD